MSTLEKYVDFIVSSFGRRISPRLRPEERLRRLVDETFAESSREERDELFNMVIRRYATDDGLAAASASAASAM